MGRQEGAEGLDGVLAVAGDGEDHRLLLALHVEEHSDVALAASGCGFIDADGGHIAQIQFPQHAADVVVHDAPQPLVGDLQLPGGGQYRHFRDQRHGGLLEQQGEVAAWPGPGHLDALGAMLRALGAGHAGVQGAVMLEEVQMPPGLVGEVVSRTGLTALRAGVEAAALGLDVEVQPVGRYGGIQVLVLEDPGRFQAQVEGQNLGAVHAMPPVVVEVISWPSSGGEFHTQRRRAKNKGLDSGPFFSFSGIASEIRIPLISFSDPSLMLNADLRLGWHLGNYLIPDYKDKVARFLDALSVSLDKKIILAGGSGGGFAALNISNLMDNKKSVM